MSTHGDDNGKRSVASGPGGEGDTYSVNGGEDEEGTRATGTQTDGDRDTDQRSRDRWTRWDWSTQ
eukprot:1123940-Pyramimonas_sp.AAC.1